MPPFIFMCKNIIVLNKKNEQLSFTDKLTASSLVKRKRAKWINDNTIKIFKTKQDFHKLKAKIIEEENRICYICNTKIPANQKATVDHVRPLKLYGEDSRENLRCCCFRCNADKKGLTINEYYFKVMSEVNAGSDKYDYLNINKFKKAVESIINKR